MSQPIRTHFLPEFAQVLDLRHDVMVVADILRATSTIVQALASGALRVIPSEEVGRARQLATEYPDGVLAGERGGLPLPGFQLGNSPAEFTAKAVKGKTIVMTTTNGTRALQRCAAARRVLIGCFLNQTAVVHELLAASGTLHIVCAGTDGQPTREDVLFAGALADALWRSAPARWIADDATRMARDLWRSADKDTPDALEGELADTRGGRNLVAIGHRHDLHDAAQMDRYSVLPELCRTPWEIVAVNRA